MECIKLMSNHRLVTCSSLKLMPEFSVLDLGFIELSSQRIDFSKVEVFDLPELFELNLYGFMSHIFAISVVLELNLSFS